MHSSQFTTRLALVAVLLFSSALSAQVAAPHAAPMPAEARAARAFEAARTAGAPELYAFLKPFPKGADLHMHLSGAVYAETFIAEAAQQGLCVAPVVPTDLRVPLQTLPAAPPTPVPPGTVRFTAPFPDKDQPCGNGTLLVSEALKNQALYDDMIDSFSMRGFVASGGITGHDQFFNTFDRFGGLKSFTGQWLDEVATRAAAQNEQYLEIMQTPSFNHVFSAIANAPWPADFNDANHMQVLTTYRDQLLANGLRDDVSIDSKELADAQQYRYVKENCSSSGSVDAVACTACLKPYLKTAQGTFCDVQIHWLYQVLRGFPPAQVFAQTLLGFELASAHPDQVVGINFVRAEDRRDAMAEYHTEMLMLDYLHSVYPKVRISLHAGELAFGMVPPQGMTFHIREALDLGHAERIGHGMDVLYETDAPALLAQMARQHTMVEVNLTSNDVILGQTRTDHPLAAYRAAHVPWALSTDDEGVSRIDLTHEYVKGALEQGLTYADLKQSARTSLEHAFLAGPSLWLFPKTGPETFTQRTPECSAAITASSKPASACLAFLAASERATQQFELERRLAVFEAAQ